MSWFYIDMLYDYSYLLIVGIKLCLLGQPVGVAYQLEHVLGLGHGLLLTKKSTSSLRDYLGK
jgi:hypothetical protein